MQFGLVDFDGSKSIKNTSSRRSAVTVVDDWLRNEEHFKKVEWDDEQYAALEEEFSFFLAYEEESDRASAVLAHARFEEWLLGRIRAEFDGVDEKTARRLDIFRPFRSFGAKIKIALALRWIDPQIYDGLEAVNRIRNRFAHHHKPIDFSDEKIAQDCRELVITNPTAALRHRYMLYLEEVRKEILHRSRQGHPGGLS